MKLFTSLLLTSAAMVAGSAFAKEAKETAVPGNAFVETRFVANKAKYNPKIGVEKDMINAWGLAIRPKGAGGHFWVTAKNQSYEYVGDVTKSEDEKLRTLHQDKLKTVKLPVGASEDNTATGVAFSDSKKDFVITQEVEGAEAITAPSKFIFASDGGIISAWTERKKEDGTFDRPAEAIQVIDGTKEGSQFFGVAISHDYDRLYAADFGEHPGVHVYDGEFKPASVTFDSPFDDNKNGQVDPGEYAPFNVQALTTGAGEHHVFVSFALTQECPKEEIKKDTCKKGELFVGEEETSKPGHGRVAEYTEGGKLVNVWKDGGHLSAPWGMAFAPANFGALSNALLVGNFGDGTIAAFNPETHEFIDVLRTAKGKPVKIEKVWGILFGNGESLGDDNTLYVASGPDDEKDGLFGSLHPVEK